MAKAINIPAEPELIEKAQAIAKKRGISLAGLVRMLIIQEVEKEEHKASLKGRSSQGVGGAGEIGNG